MKRTAVLFAAAISLGVGSTYAADPHAGHAEHAHHATAAPVAVGSGDSAASAAYVAANEKMHEAMAVALTGDADVDFLAGMIPHHQGAIDMAEVVLQYGKDPKVKKLARAIIRAQKQEIAMMNAWLQAKRAKP
jgi:uncharacterized protein (DUF305 family)